MTNAFIASQSSSVKNCLLYTRVSSSRQLIEGHSLKDQKERLTKYAHERKWRILDIYSDGGKSGKSTTGRPEFQKMLTRCSDDPMVDVILLEETDRFARNTQDHLTVKAFLRKHNIELVTSEQPNFGDDPVGNFVDTIMAGANQLQREITGEKTRRTMISLAEKGIQPGPAITGYLNSFQKGVPWKVDEEREFFIKEVFRLYLTNCHSTEKISEMLYIQGFRTKSGGRVHPSQIQKMLTDIRYAGKVCYAGKTYPGLHQPIISLEDVERTTLLMKTRNKGADRSRKYSWLLSGLIFCKKCGSLMSGELHKKSNGNTYRYYRCFGQREKKSSCDGSFSPMENIHQQLEQWIENIKFEENFYNNLRSILQEIINNQGANSKERLQSLLGRKTGIEKKMDKLEDQLLAEIIPKERIAKKYEPLKDELLSIDNELEKLKKPSANLDEKKADAIIAFLRKLPELYKAFTDNERKEFLKWFVEKIWIDEGKITKIDYTPGLTALIKRDLVRISDTWLLD